MTHREFLASYGGKLAGFASAAAGALAYVSMDPSVALLISTFLPFPFNLLAALALAGVVYVLPKWAAKKDSNNDSPE